MEFAKYYDATNIVDEMMQKKEIDSFPTGDDKFEGVYVCMDTNDFWICRINKGYNEDYEKDDDKYLIERNKLSIYDVMDKLHGQFGKLLPSIKEGDLFFEKKNKVHQYLDMFKTTDIVKAVIILDDEDGLSNWDCVATNSLEEAVATIDDGFGILKLYGR